MRRAIWSGLVLLLLAGVLGGLAAQGRFGDQQTGGEIIAARRPSRPAAPRSTNDAAGKQILFGDLHVHTTFSFDAFNISLPMSQGEGAHPPADACDYARFCSELDFWSINDHAESLTPFRWAETRRMVRECNAAALDADDPDMVTFLGWEWTQIGTTPENHYGHKNVVLLETEDDRVPTRPIASRDQLFPGAQNPYNALARLGLIAAGPGGQGRQPYHDFARFLVERAEVPRCREGGDVRSMPADCLESASTPGELFDRMDAWGSPYLVIPHGNTWGFYTPPGTSWDKQLRAHRDPDAHEFLIEVFSGHGNIEPYREWRAIERNAAGQETCPAPRHSYLPECWQAGEIIRARCLAESESEVECEKRALQARRHHVEAGGSIGWLTSPGTRVEDWLDAGQCTDCYMPAYNYRPGGSVQYALTLRNFDDPDAPKRFRFGMIGSSDVHTARPGTGYKEIHRRRITDAGLGLLGPPPSIQQQEPTAHSLPAEEIRIPGPYFERFASFFGAGGLVGAHSSGRDRHAIWNALQRKEVYGTSGDRILLWFDLVEGDRRHPMGSDLRRSIDPTFEVRAVGAFEQKSGCPPDTLRLLPAERLERLCGGECYHPSDRRRRIERIEVVRIRPQERPGEPIAPLIEDPWRVLPCDGDRDGCVVSFSDPDFAGAARDTVYYVRAIQEPTPTINGDTLRCRTDELGRCLEVSPCSAGPPTAYDDDCLADVEERAWSSPIFVDFASPSEAR